MALRRMWRASLAKKSHVTQSQAEPAAVQRACCRWECRQQASWEPQKRQHKYSQGEQHFEDQITVPLSGHKPSATMLLFILFCLIRVSSYIP